MTRLTVNAEDFARLEILEQHTISHIEGSNWVGPLSDREKFIVRLAASWIYGTLQDGKNRQNYWRRYSRETVAA